MREDREFRLDEISPRAIGKDIIRNLWVILALVLAAALAVLGAEKLLYVPRYTSSAILAVNTTSNSSAYSSLSLTSQMAGVISEIFGSEVLQNRICEQMGVDQIDGEISAAVMEDTNLIRLEVTSSNPRQAYLIISSAMDNYNFVSDYLFDNAVLRVVREPSVPYEPSNTPDTRRICILAMLAAGMAGVLAIGLFTALRFTVQTRQGAERHLDGKILGSIQYEKKNLSLREIFQKKKKSLLISHAMISMEYSENIRKIASRLSYHMRRHRQHVVMLVSVAENEGKSSVAANLALALAEKGKRVLLIDSDLKKPAQYRIFDRPDGIRRWLGDYLKGNCEANQVVSYHSREGFYTVFQNTGVEDSGGLLSSERMKQLLDACRDLTDYIILDTPPMAACSDAEILLGLADTAVMVVRQDWTDVRAINDAADVIRRSGTDFAGFILNAFRKETALGSAGAGREADRYQVREGGAVHGD